MRSSQPPHMDAEDVSCICSEGGEGGRLSTLTNSTDWPMLNPLLGLGLGLGLVFEIGRSFVFQSSVKAEIFARSVLVWKVGDWLPIPPRFIDVLFDTAARGQDFKRFQIRIPIRKLPHADHCRISEYVAVEETMASSSSDNRPISTTIIIIAMQTEALPLVDKFLLSEDHNSVSVSFFFFLLLSLV
ncbi:hypothetical protein LguiB_018011 [Lonicera macranthoides]